MEVLWLKIPYSSSTEIFYFREHPTLANGWHYGGSHEQLISILQEDNTNPDSIKLFLGYSGWDAGQLRKEIIENAWILNHLNRINPFPFAPKKMWESIMLSMGDPYRSMAKMPIDPSIN